MGSPEADGQLYIRYLKNGDEEALRTLFLKHKESLTFFLYGMVRDAEDAEELMMDTFAILASKTARYSVRKDAEFKTWLYAIARNQARAFLRRRREIPSEIWEDAAPMGDGKGEGSQSDGPEQAMLRDERNAKLWKAMQSLHPDYAQVLYLTYFENMTPSEIGRVMKKSEKQVYNLSARAKTALKGKLEGTKYSWDI